MNQREEMGKKIRMSLKNMVNGQSLHGNKVNDKISVVMMVE